MLCHRSVKFIDKDAESDIALLVVFLSYMIRRKCAKQHKFL